MAVLNSYVSLPESKQKFGVSFRKEILACENVEEILKLCRFVLPSVWGRGFNSWDLTGV